MTAAAPAILHLYPDFGAFGGIERYLLRLAEHLQARGRFRPVIACSDGGRLLRQCQQAGLSAHGLPSRRVFQSPTTRFLDMPTTLRVAQLLRQERPSLIHLHIGHLEHLWLQGLGYPRVYTVHGYGALYDWHSEPPGFKRTAKRLLRHALRHTLQQMDGILVVSHAEQARLKAQGYFPADEPPWAVLPNGVDVAALREAAFAMPRAQVRHALAIPESARLVSFIHRLDANKDPLGFFDAVTPLLAEDPDLHVLLAGDGPLRAAVAAAVAACPHAERIHPLGHRDDVPRLLAASDVLVQRARREGFGLGVLEAMAIGTPCLAYPVGGIGELLDDPALSTLRLADLAPETLTQALRAFFLQSPEANAALRETLQARAAQYSEARWVDGVEAMYDRVLAGRAAR